MLIIALLSDASAARLTNPTPSPALSEAAASHLAALDDCGAAGGSLSAAVTVAGGVVVGVSLVESTLAPDAQQCALASLFSWGFPAETSQTLALSVDLTPLPPLSQADVAAVSRVVRASSRQLRHCYEQALNHDPDLSVDLRATIGIDAGQVASLRLSASPNIDLEACLDRRLRSWQFPDSVSGEVVLPLSFSPRQTG